MDVAITELRANLRDWIEKARSGSNVVVTERGVPVARLVAVDSTDLIERLEREGVLTPPQNPKTFVARTHKRVKASGSVSELVTELRR